MLGAPGRAPPHASLLVELIDWLDEQVELPPRWLPPYVPDPEESAADYREAWGLPADVPIPNLTRLVERAGIVVGRAPCEGYFHAHRRYLILVDQRLGPAEARLSLARSLGILASERTHLDRFVMELLLPRRALLDELPRAMSLDWKVLVPLAARWKVSLGLLIRRAAGLPIANAARYRDAAEHARSLGDSGHTPALPEEVPELIGLALDRLEKGLGIDRVEVARRLGWSPEVLSTVTGCDPLPRAPGDKVISLAAWKARRGGATGAPLGQLELDFGSPPGPDPTR